MACFPPKTKYQTRCTRISHLFERQALDLKLNDLYTNIRNLDDTLRLIYLVSAGIDVAKYVATYIYDAFCMS